MSAAAVTTFTVPLDEELRALHFREDAQGAEELLAGLQQRLWDFSTSGNLGLLRQLETLEEHLKSQRKSVDRLTEELDAAENGPTLTDLVKAVVRGDCAGFAEELDHLISWTHNTEPKWRNDWERWRDADEGLHLLRSESEGQKGARELEKLHEQVQSLTEGLEEVENAHYLLLAQNQPEGVEAVAKALKGAPWSYGMTDDPNAFRREQTAVRAAMGKLRALWNTDAAAARAAWREVRGSKPFPAFHNGAHAPSEAAEDLSEASVQDLLAELQTRLEADQGDEETAQENGVRLAGLLVQLREMDAYRFAVLHPLLLLGLGAL